MQRKPTRGSTMTRRDYELIARVLRETVVVDDHVTPINRYKDRYVIRSYAEAFAAELAETNPLFDRERFLTACGVEA